MDTVWNEKDVNSAIVEYWEYWAWPTTVEFIGLIMTVIVMITLERHVNARSIITTELVRLANYNNSCSLIN